MLKNTVRRYLIMYFCPETERWEYDRKTIPSKMVRSTLTRYESEGCLHPYEVIA